ncbi:hypothetical protein RJT34_02990 [Clitoria ternatea]|uniref:Uncharacterized protein n=1 Tax=Clitoria ternatea TaxID=43366 RepID=A0AAN9Q0T1_CLITE
MVGRATENKILEIPKTGRNLLCCTCLSKDATSCDDDRMSGFKSDGPQPIEIEPTLHKHILRQKAAAAAALVTKLISLSPT